jgi:ParB family chromosome partitioning protein
VTPVRRGGLGRGLGALIVDTSVPVPAQHEQVGGGRGEGSGQPGREESEPRGALLAGTRYRELPVDAITPNPRQPREYFDEDALEELASSIREVGLLQPVVVRETVPGSYELVMGERRWRASRKAGLQAVPALIRDTGDASLLRDALLENLHRVDLNPLEEAAAYGQLLEEFGATHEELAGRVARSRSHITNTLRLLQLPPAVQLRVAAGVLSAGHARALLALDDADAQEALAIRIVAEGLSVRAVEEEVALARSQRAVRTRRDRQHKVPTAEMQELSEVLSDRFETRVSVSMGRAKGRIVVEFASPDDLHRILATMAPGAELPRSGDVDEV